MVRKSLNKTNREYKIIKKQINNNFKKINKISNLIFDNNDDGFFSFYDRAKTQ